MCYLNQQVTLFLEIRSFYVKTYIVIPTCWSYFSPNSKLTPKITLENYLN